MEGGQFAGRSPSPTSGHEGELSDLLGHGQLQPLVCLMCAVAKPYLTFFGFIVVFFLD